MSELPPCVRRVHPQRRVWVDVRHVFPRGRGPHVHTPAGVELAYEVPGLVDQVIKASDGSVLARVTFLLNTQDQQWSLDVTQLVSEHLLRDRPLSAHRKVRVER